MTPEERRIYMREWHQKHPGYMKDWKSRNPESVARYRAKSRRPPLAERECDWCGALFLPNRADTRVCGRSCGNKVTYLRDEYKMTVVDWHSLTEKQGHRCAICGIKPEKWQVDHDHLTGEVRGLLCGPCNRAIGHARDDPAIFQAAIRYLETHNARHQLRLVKDDS